jgi:hypothetical protein
MSRGHSSAENPGKGGCDLVRGHAARPFQFDDPGAAPGLQEQFSRHAPDISGSDHRHRLVERLQEARNHPAAAVVADMPGHLLLTLTGRRLCIATAETILIWGAANSDFVLTPTLGSRNKPSTSVHLDAIAFHNGGPDARCHVIGPGARRGRTPTDFAIRSRMPVMPPVRGRTRRCARWLSGIASLRPTVVGSPWP